MKKTILYTISTVFVILLLNFSSCNKVEETLEPSPEVLFPEKSNTELDRQLETIFGEYNTRVEYQYIKNNIPVDWFHIAPIKEELIIPLSEFLRDLWIIPLEKGSNKDLVIKTFPKKIVYVGSLPVNKEGIETQGTAEGGVVLTLSDCNSYDLNDLEWVRKTIKLSFHEYAHILHMQFKLPDEYRKITPDNYTQSGWNTLSENDALKLGMISPYGTSSPSEDFAELYAIYITSSQEELNHIFTDEPYDSSVPTEILEKVERNKGRALIRQKFAVLNKFITGIGMDIEKIREEVQNKLN